MAILTGDFIPHCKCGSALIERLFISSYYSKSCGAEYEVEERHCPPLVCIDDRKVKDKVNARFGDHATWKVKTG